ncbi:MAG: nitrogenase component 1 [Gemmatimonadaceae bacterium]|nr:nitrogenase component 1 [Gemmatimonadaceae bacterium]
MLERERWARRRQRQSRLPWYSRSVDSTYLTGKRVFIFADGTHAVAAARIARDELGFTVVGIGTYSREMAREVRERGAEVRRRGAHLRRLSRRGSSGHRELRRRAGARHADGAPHRQAAGRARAR